MVFFDYQGSDCLGGNFNNWPSVYNAYVEVYSIFVDVPISDAKTLVLSGDSVQVFYLEEIYAPVLEID